MKTKIAELVCDIIKEKQWGIFFKHEPMKALPVQDNTSLYKINEVNNDELMDAVMQALAGKKGQYKGRTDRQRIIDWYKSDLEEYRGMIGKYTEYNTLVTEELVKRTEDRILELEEKEKEWHDTIRRLLI